MLPPKNNVAINENIIPEADNNIVGFSEINDLIAVNGAPAIRCFLPPAFLISSLVFNITP